MKCTTLVLSLLLVTSTVLVGVGVDLSQKAKADYYFWDDFDPIPLGGWSRSGLWHEVDQTSDPCIGAGGHPTASYSPFGMVGYHSDSTCSYDTGAANSGQLTSPSIDLNLPSAAWLHFMMWYDAEAVNTIVDVMWVQGSIDGSIWNNELQIINTLLQFPESQWVRVDVNLAGYVGDPSVWIRFSFDSVDMGDNMYAGWYVDDVLVDDVPPPALPGAALPFRENFDSPPLVGWSWTSQWHLAGSLTDPCMAQGGTPTPPPYRGHPKDGFSSPNAFGYHKDPLNPSGPDCTYNDGARTKGWLKTPPIDLVTGPPTEAHLSFWFWADVELGFEQLEVQLSADNEMTYGNLDTINPYLTNQPRGYKTGMWSFFSVDISTFIGNTVWIRFFFDTTDAWANDFAGWYIDDVVVDQLPTIQSKYISTQNPPVANGNYGQGEYYAPDISGAPLLPRGANNWENLSLITGNPVGAYLIVENDANKFYIVYDVIGDTTNDGPPNPDGAHIAFDPLNDDMNGGPSGDTDDEWGMDGAYPAGGRYHYIAGAFADTCATPGANCASGFGPSPNNPTPHRIYEFEIPFSAFSAIPSPLPFGYTMGFAGTSGPSGVNPGIWDENGPNPSRFDQWPSRPGAPLNSDEYGDLIVGSPQVLANDYPMSDDGPRQNPGPPNFVLNQTDAFRFEVENWDHSVVGIRESNPSDNYDLTVFSDTAYSPPPRARSSAGAGMVDVVVLDKISYAGPPDVGAAVTWNIGTSDYHIEMENDFDDHLATDSWAGRMENPQGSTEVLDAFEVAAPANGNYDILLTMDPSLDLDLFLFDITAPALTQASRTGPPPATAGTPLASSETDGVGVSESLSGIALQVGIDYLIVVTNENGGIGNYYFGEVLNVGWTNLAQPFVFQWNVSVEMLGLSLTSTGYTNLTSLRVDLLGSALGTDVSAVTLYHDTNGNQNFEPGTDTLLARDQFVVGTATLSLPVPFPVTFGTIEDLLLMYNIDPLASPGALMGAQVEDPADLMLDDGDLVIIAPPAVSTLSLVNPGSPPLAQSRWQSTAPTADGAYTAGEHIIIPGVNAINTEWVAGNPFSAWLIFENDETNLYVTMDVVGDTTNDGGGDRSTFAFDTDNDGNPTDGADDEFTSAPDHLEYDAMALSWLSVDLCASPGIICAQGFGGSPNNASNHVIFEYQVPLAEIGASPIPSTPIGCLLASHSGPGISDASSLFGYSTLPQFLFGPPPLTEYADCLLAPVPHLNVSGTPKTSGLVLPGQADVLMEQLVLTAFESDIDVTGIKVDQTDTGVDADTGNVYLYHDFDDNGFLDTLVDNLLDTQIFSAGTLTFSGAPLITVSVGTPESLLIVFDIAAGATPGNNLTLSLLDSSYVTATAPAVVDLFPRIDSNTVNLPTAGMNNVTVLGVQKASGAVFIGTNDVVMGQLNISVDADNATLTSVRVDQVGTAIDSDTGEVTLYHDFNDNGILDIGTDELLGVQVFTGGTATIGGLSFFLDSTVVERFLGVVNVSATATPGNTIQLRLLNSGYVTVNAPDLVNATTFPLVTDFVTITAPGLTVSGTPVATGPVNTGTSNVVMESLNLTSNYGTITVTSLKVDMTGTGMDGDTVNIYLYDDSNDNGSLDLGTDFLLDTKLFTGGTLTFGPLTYNVVSGTPEHMLIVFDVNALATPGNTLRARMLDSSYVTVSSPAVVQPFLQISSNEVLITAVGADVLTVSGIPKASGTVYPGDSNVLMEQLVLNASANSVTVTAIALDMTGTGIDADTAEINLYDDAGGNGVYDPGPDALLSTQTFSGGTLTFSGLTIVVSAGSDRSLLIAFNVSSGATPLNTLRARLLDKTYVTVNAPDVVSTANFPIVSNTVTIVSPAGNVLTVSGTPVASGTVTIGQTGVVMERLTLTSSAMMITVTGITVDRTGADPDVASAMLYHDGDNDGALDPSPTDTLLGQGVFSGGALTFSGLSFPVTSGIPENMLVVINISIGATAGNTVSILMASSAYVSVTSPDVVSSSNFPIESNLVTILAPAPTTGTIQGKVVDQGSNALANATVQLINATGSIVATASTNATGDFAFSPAFGTYTINATKYGYEYNNSAPSASITSGSPTYNYGNVVLRAAAVVQPPTDGAIEGQVTDANGNPVQGAAVTLLDGNGNTVATKTTDGSGRFKFDPVDFGTYTLSVSKNGYVNSTSGEFTLDAGNPEFSTATTLSPAPSGPPGTVEKVPDWLWLLAVLFIVLFVIFLLLFLMGRRKPKPVQEKWPSDTQQVFIGDETAGSAAEKPKEGVQAAPQAGPQTSTQAGYQAAQQAAPYAAPPAAAGARAEEKGWPKCGFEKHVTVNRTLTKAKKGNKFSVKWTEGCNVATCNLDQGHSSAHETTSSVRKCTIHPDSMKREEFDTREERDARYAQLEIVPRG